MSQPVIMNGQILSEVEAFVAQHYPDYDSSLLHHCFVPHDGTEFVYILIRGMVDDRPAILNVGATVVTTAIDADADKKTESYRQDFRERYLANNPGDDAAELNWVPYCSASSPIPLCFDRRTWLRLPRRR